MENIKKRHNIALKALLTLKTSLDKFQAGVPDEYVLEVRDAVIKRFEYSLETLWKFLKIYLQEVQKVILESTTPRSIIRASVDANIISKQDGDNLVECLTVRNETSHTYNEELAKRVVIEIYEHYDVMRRVLQEIKLQEDDFD